jgi:hypothetical protein
MKAHVPGMLVRMGDKISNYLQFHFYDEYHRVLTAKIVHTMHELNGASNVERIRFRLPPSFVLYSNRRGTKARTVAAAPANRISSASFSLRNVFEFLAPSPSAFVRCRKA